jgi:hypothetical protein
MRTLGYQCVHFHPAVNQGVVFDVMAYLVMHEWIAEYVFGRIRRLNALLFAHSSPKQIVVNQSH